MTWQVIVAAIWSVFGPVIREIASELIKKWLDDLLNRAAKSMHGEPAAYPGPGAQRYALFTRAIAMHDTDGERLWFWQKLPWSRHTRQRRLLESMRAKSEQLFLTDADNAELRGLCQLAA